MHERERIVLTGGPGAGKSAVLETVRRTLCEHVLVLPEAAGVLFRGGFPRRKDRESVRAAQRAIFHVQRELEAVGDVPRPAVVLCDRGTVDVLAYWPGPAEDFWAATRTGLDAELHRYELVLHLRTPGPVIEPGDAAAGAEGVDPVPLEAAVAAAVIDARVEQVWRPHPRRVLIESRGDFLADVRSVIAILLAEMPACCTRHLEASLERVR